MIGSQKYQQLIQDIKDIDNQIKLTNNQIKKEQLKNELSKLLDIKSSMYSNIGATIKAIKEV